MAYLLKENNAHSTINQVGGLTLIDTTLIVTDASSFPVSGDFLITVWDSDTYPDPTDDSGREIIKVTGVVGNTFTIERGQEDTVASLHANGTIIAMLITAGTFEELEQAIDDIAPSSQLTSLFGQEYDGDLRPIEDYGGQGGGFQLDSNNDIQPKITTPADALFEYDINNDLIPKE